MTPFLWGVVLGLLVGLGVGIWVTVTGKLADLLEWLVP